MTVRSSVNDYVNEIFPTSSHVVPVDDVQPDFATSSNIWYSMDASVMLVLSLIA